MFRFTNRSDAGKRLAKKLQKYANRSDTMVLALPRGGIPVAYEIAMALGLPLDVFLVRKLGVPGQEELAMGAIASGGVRVLNDNVIRMLGIPDSTINAVAKNEEQELKRREVAYRGDTPPFDVQDHTVILVDDGLATGATMRAAVAALGKRGPAEIVVAVPVASAEACAELGDQADGIICLITPEPFYSVGTWYEDFSQTADEEVRYLLKEVRNIKRNTGEKP